MVRTQNSDAVRLGLALAASIAGAVISGVLLLQHYGLDAGLAAAACDALGSGCERVAASSWSAVLGVPLAAVGLGFFVSLAFLLTLALLGGIPLSGRPVRLALLLLGLALAVDGFLLGVQAFAIGAFCSLCLMTYGTGAAAFLALLPARRKAPAAEDRSGTAPPAPGPPLEAFAVRVFWVAAGLVAAAVLVINQGLRVQGEAAAAVGDVTILGVRGDAAPWEDDPAGRAHAPVSLRLRTAGLASQWRNPSFRQQPVQEVGLEGIPYRGDGDAPVRIVTFSDFLCPSCRRFALAFDQYAEGPTGPHVALHYRSYPLDQTCAAHLPRVLHPGACTMARGAACAHRLGRFWEYHDAVYAGPPQDPTPADVRRIALGAGLDRAAFESCMAEPEAEAALQRDIAEGVRLGVTGTPTIFINGRRLPSLDEFADAVLWELEKAGIELPPGSSGEGSAER